MKRLKSTTAGSLGTIILATVLFLLFVVWAEHGSVWQPFTAFFPRFHVTAAGATVVFLLLLYSAGGVCERIFSFFVRYRYVLLPLVFAAISLGVLLLTPGRTAPSVVDEVHFIWLARMLLRGDVIYPAEVPYQHFQDVFVLLHDGMVSSIFPPGFPVVLAPFVLFGVPWLCNPILTVLTIIVIGLIADRTAGPETSFTAMLIALFSYTLLVQSTMYFAHPLSMLLTTLVLYIFITRPLTGGYLLAAGAFMGFFVLVRPQDALFTTAGLTIYLLLRYRLSALRRLFIFGVFPAVGAVCLLLMNRYITGEFLLFPQDIYFHSESMRENCHRFGFGAGCFHHSGKYLSWEGFTPRDALWVAALRLSSVTYRFFPHPLFAVLLVTTAGAIRRRWMPIVAVFAGLFSGYFFFYIPGVIFGARYLSGGAVLLLIPSAYGCVMAVKKVRSLLPRSLVLGTVTAAMVVPAAVFYPEKFAADFTAAYDDVKQEISSRDINDSLIFVHNKHTTLVSYLRSGPRRDNRGNIILRDHMFSNAGAIRYYRKQGYRAAYRVVKDVDNHLRLLHIPGSQAMPGVVSAEMEYMFPSLTGTVRYLNWTHAPGADLFFGLEKPEYQFFSGYAGLTVSFGPDTPESYYDFSVYVHEAGRYRVTLSYAAAPCGGDMTLTIDGEPVALFSSEHAETRMMTRTVEHYLPAGPVVFAIVPHKGNTCVILDALWAKHRCQER